MSGSGIAPRRFGNYELDSYAGRLLRDGQPVKIQPQPLRVLSLLVERPGEIVSREDLRLRIWGEATFVEFDNGLNYCIHQIRSALHDEAWQPVYIETLPKQGYRFIAQVDAAPASNAVPATGVPPAGIPVERKSVSLRWAIGACVAVAAGIGVWWISGGRNTVISHPLRVTRVSKLTSHPGDEREPAISPDGQYVAFSWSGEAGSNYDIYVLQPGGQRPLRLTSDPAPDSFPAWSPDSRPIAFVRRRDELTDIVVVPVLGGTEQTLHRFSRSGADLDFSQHPLLVWSQDGKSIIYSGQSEAAEKSRLSLLSVETGSVRSITSPAGELVGDSSPALSADGRFLAFVRYLAPYNGHLLIQRFDTGMVAEGSPIDVTKSGLAIHSPIWLTDGDGLLFADNTQIFQWERNKSIAAIYAADGTLEGMSLGPKRIDQSRQLVVASRKTDPDIWMIPLAAGGIKASGPPQVIQRSTENETHPEFSPDGRQIVFSSARSGNQEIWVADADGGNPRQITHLGAHIANYPSWSPDGTQIVFHARVPDISEVYVVDASGGVPRQVTHENPGLAVATWSRDGRFIYASTLVGGSAFSYRIPVGGGPAERLWAGDYFQESPDGKYILYTKTDAPGIFRRSLAGDASRNPEEQLVADFRRTNQIGGYAAVPGGIYYVSGNAQGQPSAFRYFDLLSHKSVDIAPAVAGLAQGFTVSPDLRHMAFSASAEVGGNLLALELR